MQSSITWLAKLHHCISNTQSLLNLHFVNINLVGIDEVKLKKWSGILKKWESKTVQCFNLG